ncbi:MAG: lamin tail domain-containing protein, partial [bacterium]|nr:lamin tail domain-containing protein [bacterium]
DYDNTYGVDFFGIDWANRSYSGWGNGGFGSDGGQLPPLIDRILNIPAYEAQYRRYLRELVGSVGDPAIPSTTYNDTVGDVFAGLGPHYDIVSVEVGNDASMLYFTVEVDGPVDVGGDTGNGEYLIFLDTKPGGSTGNAWGRQINATVDHDYFIGSWPDGGGGAQFWKYDGGWYQPGGGLSIDLTDKANGRISYAVPLSDLELSEDDVFAFDVVATGGGSSDPGVDHLSNPAVSTPDWSTPSTPGAYLNYTVVEVIAPPAVEGPFTLDTVEAQIDVIAAMVGPYAWVDSYAPPNNDYPSMFNNTNFPLAFTTPTTFSSGQNPWGWGVKPYIEARTASLRATVPEPTALPELYVNEILAYNCDINSDGAGDYDDWVEIYNGGAAPADLGGMYLTDDPGNPTQWEIPAGTTIPSGEFLLVWCDNEAVQGPLHATFKLAVAGEGVGLYHDDANGNVLIDYVAYPPLQGNVSYGRYPDGAATLETFTNVTPELGNDNSGGPPPEPGPVPAVYINEWMADNDGAITDEMGQYEDWFELYNAETFPVDLGGMHLTDDLDDMTQWRIPDETTIPPGGFLLIWADDDAGDGPLHANFKLGKSGEEIGLFDSRSNCLAEIDTVVFGAQTTDVSEGRYADGTPCIITLRAYTPGETNMSLLGDFDDDGDVDSLDYADLEQCIAGPDAAPAAGCPVCVDPDLDDDGDADLADYAEFQESFSG